MLGFLEIVEPTYGSFLVRLVEVRVELPLPDLRTSVRCLFSDQRAELPLKIVAVSALLNLVGRQELIRP